VVVPVQVVAEPRAVAIVALSVRAGLAVRIRAAAVVVVAESCTGFQRVPDRRTRCRFAGHR
jgi:hypothetical protein